ncbi:hypothetical protein QJS04_geneDACA019003 [Acorus gramineus]|uniref:Uncharacterized protein n=1 Tax=Acorus gramineus TaxID=55184 RepID=A0AAV9BDU5_ACOGR|nr:hypothetical protein QJS04_geneDACA023059 [Acorus gramineus]KAK1274640.1 hypothetical protein QJS04_geneDACA019003 [Acorus gramineus]
MGEVVFKGLTASLGLATLYLAATFSVNVYRGLSWHNSQSVFPSSLSIYIYLFFLILTYIIYSSL